MIVGIPKEIKNNENRVSLTLQEHTRVGTERSHGVYTTHHQV